MYATRETRRHVGEILVDEGLITREELDRALARQQETHVPLGQLLIELGYVSRGAMANALAEQHGGLLRTEYGVSLGLHPGAAPEPAPAEPAVAQPDPFAAWQAAVAERDARLADLAAAVRERDTLLASARARVAGLEAAALERERVCGEERAAAAAERDQLRAHAATTQREAEAREHEVQALRARLAAAEAALPGGAGEGGATGHVLVVPGADGYHVEERPGPPPRDGEQVGDYRVIRVGLSPIPGDRRPCAYVVHR
jgi:hypothetical protein